MKTVLRVLGMAVGVAAVGYFVVFAYRTLTTYDVSGLFTAPIVGAIGVAALAYALLVPTTSWAWDKLLRGMDVRLPILQLNMILGLTQIAKYVPGNVGQYLGRSAMSAQRGIPPFPLFSALTIEFFLAIAAALFTGAVAFSFLAPSAYVLSAEHRDILLAAALVSVVLLACAPVLLRKVPALTPRLAAHIKVPAVGTLGAAFAAYVLNYILIGIGLYIIAVAAVGAEVVSLPLYVCVFALSWIIGFAVPGAPAGLGVREGIMAAMLAPTLASAHALQIIVAFRIATTLGDLMAFAWGGSLYWLERRNALRASHR